MIGAETAAEKGFLPGVLAEWSRASADSASLPLSETFNGAFLSIDVSGFTELTVRLSREDERGVGRIHGVLSEFFSGLIQIIERYGGTIFGFEGDSLFAGWRWEPSTSPKRPFSASCRCALEIKRSFGERLVHDQVLRLRIAIGSGEIKLLHLGDAGRRCYMVPAGSAVDESAALLIQADAEEILIAPNGEGYLGAAFSVERHDESAVRLLGVAAEETETQHPLSFNAIERPEDLSRYLPKVLQSRLDLALHDWIGEFRTVTAVFLNIHASDHAFDLNQLNATTLLAERYIEEVEGEIMRVASDDRTLTIFGVFGLPAASHEDNAQRAILAVENVRTKLQNEALTVSAGISTGKVFCGPVGPDHQRDYTVLGTAVNVAARLGAVAAGRTLVDESTVIPAERTVQFDGPWPFRLSGIRKTVNAFTPLKRRTKIARPLEAKITGRDRELERLEALRAGSDGDRANVVVVEGTPGIGKTTLLSAFMQQCTANGVSSIEGAADALDTKTPYLAWRPVIRSCFSAFDARADQTIALEKVLDRLSSAGIAADLAPLLNDVVDLNIPSNAMTAGMSGSVRSENLRDILVKLIGSHLQNSKRLLVLEDVHWMDENSWALFYEVLEIASPALILLSCRPWNGLESVLKTLQENRHPHEQMPLQPLSKTETTELVRRRLGSDLQDYALGMIVETSDGNPLFIDELCNLLIGKYSAGLPTINSGARNAEPTFEVPHLLEAAIQSQLDSLSPEDQLVLKTGSVMGMRFSPAQLSFLDHITDANVDVEAAIERILGFRLLTAADGSHDVSFRHRVIRDLVYDGMLAEQRQDIHAAIANLLESAGTGRDVERLPVILNHWRNAGESKKLIRYLDQVAMLRLRQFDNAGVIELIDEAFTVRDKTGTPIDAERAGHLHLMHGKAYSGLGLMTEARQSYEKGFALMRLPLPQSKLGLVTGLAGKVLQQTRQRMFGSRAMSGSADDLSVKDPESERLFDLARAHEDLTRIFYFIGDKGRLLYSAISAANYAGNMRAPTSELAVSYASVGAICGVIPLRSQASHYIGKATELAERFDEPGTTGRVHLLSGLYSTAVGRWIDARDSFYRGLDAATHVGDKRLWSELAVSLETISGPWPLTPAFEGVEAWEKLVTEICAVGRDRGDKQVTVCGVLGRLRGYRMLGKKEEVDQAFIDVAAFLSQSEYDVELIHRIEGLSYLALRDFERGQIEEGGARVKTGHALLAQLTSGMKSRTLPGLAALFDASLLYAKLGPQAPGDPSAIEGVKVVLKKLAEFSRIYPIGQPEHMRCSGDLSVLLQNQSAADKHWRASIKRAEALSMPLPGIAAALRLRSKTGGAEYATDNAICTAVSLKTPAAREIADHLLHADHVFSLYAET